MTCAQGLLRLLWGGPKLECYGTALTRSFHPLRFVLFVLFLHSFRALRFHPLCFILLLLFIVSFSHSLTHSFYFFFYFFYALFSSFITSPLLHHSFTFNHLHHFFYTLLPIFLLYSPHFFVMQYHLHFCLLGPLLLFFYSY